MIGLPSIIAVVVLVAVATGHDVQTGLTSIKAPRHEFPRLNGRASQADTATALAVVTLPGGLETACNSAAFRLTIPCGSELSRRTTRYIGWLSSCIT
jgi:hypothetical protein